MIACLYGRAYLPFVETAVRDLCAAAAAAQGVIEPLAVESALARPAACAAVRRLYVLPFDPPPAPSEGTAFLRRLFPRAEIVPALAAQDLCWDRVATQERLLERGVPVPESFVGVDPAAFRAFVRTHPFVVLKPRYGCGGHGLFVVWEEGDALFADGGSHLYRLVPVPGGACRLDGDVLTYPPPFHAQRLVATVGSHGVAPAQTLRAYVVDHHIVFWTERYREHYARPSDWIVTAARGARYRFVQVVSDEAHKVALRAAEGVGARVCAVDIVRTGSSAPYVIGVGTDGRHMLIDRSFKDIPEYRDFFDLDRYVAEALLAEPPPPRPARPRPPARQTGRRGTPGRRARGRR